MTQESTTANMISQTGNIGKLLLESGKLTIADAERVLVLQKEQKIRFGEAAIKLGCVSEADIQFALSQQFSYPYLEETDETLAQELIAAYQPFAKPVEALRKLRSQLMLRWFANGHKRLTIVGADNTPLSSLIAANLAIVFSQLGEKTLLIDSDLRRPALNKYFKTNTLLGLSDVLAGRSDLRAVNRIPSLLGLSVLNAGTLPPNPQELLSRSNFDALLKQADLSFDVVILTAPPISEFADAQVLAAKTRGVLLVAEKDITSLNSLGQANSELTAMGAEVLGCVLSERWFK